MREGGREKKEEEAIIYIFKHGEEKKKTWESGRKEKVVAEIEEFLIWMITLETWDLCLTKKKSNVIIGKISNCWVEVWSCMWLKCGCTVFFFFFLVITTDAFGFLINT